MKSLFRLASLLFVICFSGGCAARFGVNSQNVTFDSNPKGAMVYLNGKFIGVTPLTIFLPLHPTRKEIFDKKAEIVAGDADEDDLELLMESGYKVNYIKEGFPSIEFYINPTIDFQNSTNSKLCKFDLVYSPLLFFIPTILNDSIGRCRAFEKVYNKKLANSKDSESSLKSNYSPYGIGGGLMGG